MNWHNLKRVVRRVAHRKAVEAELDDEIQSFLERDIEEKIASGITSEEARRRALLELGGTEQVKETMRDSRSMAWLDGILADVRYALRTFSKRPAFTFLAIFTLSLGIGAATAVFSIVDKVLLKPLPYKDADRLVSVWATDPEWRNNPVMAKLWNQFSITYTQYEALKGPNSPFEDIAVFEASGTEVFQDSSGARRVGVGFATGELFTLLGLRPKQGRLFTAEDEGAHGNPAVLISDAFWRREFSADPAVIGKSIDLEDPSPALAMAGGIDPGRQSYMVIGVLPVSFQLIGLGADSSAVPDVWLPVRPSAHGFLPEANTFEAIGHLKTGISVAEGEATSGRILTASRPQLSGPGSIKEEGAHLINRRSDEGGDAKTPLFLLFGSSALLLVIALINVANLILGQSALRRHEVMLRAAIGATKRRIVRQLVTESLVLALAAGTVGSLVATWTIRGLVQLAPSGLPHIGEVRIDYRVLLFVLVISIMSGVVFGLAPAFATRWPDLAQSLKQAGASQMSKRTRWPAILIVAEIGLSFILLITSGLLVRSILNLDRVSPGLRPTGLLMLDLRLNNMRYGEPAERAAFYSELAARIRSLPSVQDITEVGMAPFTDQHAVTILEVENESNPIEKTMVENRNVLPNYFSVSGTRILIGRGFTEADVRLPLQQPPPRGRGPDVVVVSRSMARHFWGKDNAVGKRFRLRWGSEDGFWVTIVGVCEDVPFFGPSKGAVDVFYYPALAPQTKMALLIRTLGDPSMLAPAVRKEIATVDKNLPIDRLETMKQLISDSTGAERYRTTLIVAFALIASVLTFVGLYGAVSRFVAFRTHELAIRMAIGAHPSYIVRMILHQNLILVLLGVAGGVVIACASASLLSGLLFGVSPLDIPTYIGTAISLVVVSLIAAYLPARRAAATDPMITLRPE